MRKWDKVGALMAENSTHPARGCRPDQLVFKTQICLQFSLIDCQV